VAFGFNDATSDRYGKAPRDLDSPREYLGCVSHVPGSYQSVTYEGQRVDIWLINSKHSIELFFRWLIIKTTETPEEMAQLSFYAFRQLEFVGGCFDGIKGMTGSYMILVEKIVHDLAYLSDHGTRIFKGSWRDAPAEFAGGAVNISDENGKTKRNNTAKGARSRKYDGKDRHFWWHIKLSPHQNRIHIWPDRVSEGKSIVVGIFCHHL